jgi:hypothetical protein
MDAPVAEQGVNRAKSPKRGQIAALIRENYATTGKPTLVCEIMQHLGLSRTRANEIVQAMGIAGEICVLNTEKKGQARQVLPFDALLPRIFFSDTLRHRKSYLQEFPDEALMAKFCEITTEIKSRESITFDHIQEYGRHYGIMEG